MSSGLLSGLFIALIILVLLVGIIYLVSYLLRLVPRYAHIVQVYFELGKSKVSQITNLSVEPILRISTILAALRYAARKAKGSGMSSK